MKEVKAWHRLDHPHVARLHGIVQLPNTIAMVSSWCENGTIVRYLREKNPNANRLQLVRSFHDSGFLPNSVIFRVC